MPDSTEAFDRVADDYDRARPRYPAGVFDLLSEVAGGLAGRFVVEGGSGTGIATRELTARGAQVIAVEPGGEMLRIGAAVPGALPVQADAAALPVKDRSADLCCYAQSWHWLTQPAGSAEAARVLVDGGHWAAWWSQPVADGERWFDATWALFETTFAGVTRDQRDHDWGVTLVDHRFASPERRLVRWTRTVARGDWIAELGTTSYVASLDPEPRLHFLAEVASLLDRVGADDPLVVPYQTTVWTARREGQVVTGVDPDLRARVLAWIDDDPDPATRTELRQVLDAADATGPGAVAAVADLADRFAGRLGFGTAGLRGPLGAGPNRMNVAVVQRAAAGVAAWVVAGRSTPDETVARGLSPADRGVVIGFDARHRSRDFAEASAAVIAGAGVVVHLLPEPLPTPVLAFAVRQLGTAAGIMVTASHNPPEDNGYKVYDGTGRQIVPPADAEIAATIASTASVADLPLAAGTDRRIRRLGPEVADAYVDAASRIGPVPAARKVRLASTALHGVGATTLRRTLTTAGFAAPDEAAAQAAPDPDFPTVAFPNPEEPGALDVALATAAASGADLLLANDPDADRLGAAIPPRDPGARDEPAAWRVLRGDEIGVILADHLLRSTPMARLDGAVVATTIVSSTMLRSLAAEAGVAHAETLTGFKWLTRAAGPEQHRLFAYEEALGFCIGDLVGDKDGITAALVLAEAAALQAEAGRTLHDVLDDLDLRHGVHATGQWSVRVGGADGRDRLDAAMAHVRAHPPEELAGQMVLDVVDLRDGDPERGYPPSDVLTWHLDGGRVVVRPSGTEPKLKCYVEVVVPVRTVTDLAAARAQAASTLARVTAAAASATGLA